VNALVRRADGFDLHVIADDGSEVASTDADAVPAAARRRRRRRWTPPPRRRVVAVLLAVVGLPLLTAVLALGRDVLTLSTDLLLFLVATVAIAVLGGVTIGTVAAVAASLLLNWFFVEPIHTLTIADPENVVALIIFVAAAIGASVLVNRVAARSREALQARAEAEALAHTSSILIGEPDPLPALLDQLRTSFSLDAVSLLSNRDDGWIIDASAGENPPTEPFDGERWDLNQDGTSVVVLRGRRLSVDDQRVLSAFLSNLALALRSRRLQAEAAAAEHLAETDELRTALLQAVGHDLRTPLATIKASASSMLQSDVTWDAEHVRDFAETIDSEADRLNRLVGNLLDMSRLNAGALTVARERAYLDDVVAGALASLDHDPAHLRVNIPPSVPAVEADPALLERAVANVIANAIAWSPETAPVLIEGAEVAGRVHLRVIDRGPGVDPDDRERVFQPFQHRGDGRRSGGIGLGLAVARGFVEAIGGHILLDDTPGGGLTVLIDLAEAVPAGAVPSSSAT
jgi:two-component system sensor histidine kinase KdpD